MKLFWFCWYIFTMVFGCYLVVTAFRRSPAGVVTGFFLVILGVLGAVVKFDEIPRRKPKSPNPSYALGPKGEVLTNAPIIYVPTDLFGMIGDGKTDNSKQFKQAIEFVMRLQKRNTNCGIVLEITDGQYLLQDTPEFKRSLIGPYKIRGWMGWYLEDAREFGAYACQASNDTSFLRGPATERVYPGK